MGTQVTLVYTVTPVGTTGAALAALINSVAVPLPKDILDALGLRVVSDLTAIGATVTRTVILSFDPSVAATVAAMTINSGGEIESVVANPGLDYILPPLLTVNYPPGRTPPVGKPPQLRATLNAQAVAIVAGGAGYVAPTATFLGGLPPPTRGLGSLSGADDPIKLPPVVGCVKRVYVKTQGLGYPVGTTCRISGGGTLTTSPTIPATATVVRDAFGRITGLVLTDMGAGYVKTPKVELILPPGFVPTSAFKEAKAFAVMAEGTPARAGVITVVAGAITAIAVATNGANYNAVPDILITDAVGTGAIARARMGVGRIDVINPSIGVPATVTVSFGPVFQRYFPSLVVGNDPNQQRPFFRLLEASLMQAGFTPVVSADPLVA